jgi:hypothetical protein
VPGKDFEETLFEDTLWWSFPGAAKKNRTRLRPGRKNWNIKKMTFTGTLIESLMATVERAERGASSDEPMFAQNFAHNIDAQPWLASIQQNADYDSKFLGVA